MRWSSTRRSPAWPSTRSSRRSSRPCSISAAPGTGRDESAARTHESGGDESAARSMSGRRNRTVIAGRQWRSRPALQRLPPPSRSPRSRPAPRRRSGASSNRRHRPGSRSRFPLGEPGDLSFWAPNRGLLTVNGNDTIPRGIYSWNGQSWHQLATVCGGPADTARIAWAGPDEFWVDQRTQPAASGLRPCSVPLPGRTGHWLLQHAARIADPFRQMLSATCSGPADCWFGGVGSQDALGERVGAFHLHWNGATLESRLRAAGAGGQRHGVPRRQALREHARWPRAGEPRRPGGPGRIRAGSAPDPHDRRRRTFTNDPFTPGRCRQKSRATAASCWRSTATVRTSGPSAAARPRGPRRRWKARWRGRRLPRAWSAANSKS